METPKFLIYVDGIAGNNNKFYNMYPEGGTFRVEFGRVGASSQKATYNISKWSSKYNEKIKKGYKDITELKATDVVVQDKSGNSSFDEFYDVFQKYTGSSVKKNYLIESCTQKQIDTAQAVLNEIQKIDDLNLFNTKILELFKIIPRQIYNVKDEMLVDLSTKNKFIAKEQDALDGMTSSNIIYTTNPFKELNIEFEEVKASEVLEKLTYSTMQRNRCKIYKVYRIHHSTLDKNYNAWLDKQDNKHTELLIHGTRNPNVFSILKTGLMIRPTNAAVISGAAYGEGTYFSAHADKSLNYTGYDPDKIFFIHDVHMGNYFTYEGWYRDGKSISRSEMNYRDLKKKGYDSLFVKPGDGLLNSEYIVYNVEQYKYSYLVWMK